MIAAVEVGGVDLHGSPQLRGLGGIDVEVGRQTKALRHDAYDLDRHVIEHDFAADDVGVSGELRLPDGVAEDRELADRWAILFGREHPAQ